MSGEPELLARKILLADSYRHGDGCVTIIGGTCRASSSYFFPIFFYFSQHTPIF